ncbi:MAG: PilW family protein [Burkholderiaceae bacterium]|nr:PilW family protein [Burkholderiaceae bacterium]
MIQSSQASALCSSQRRHARGFTLVELMVAVTVGLILSLVITGTVLNVGKQFRVVGSNISAQGSAQIALSLIDVAGRAAGAGMFNNGQLICPALNAWRDGVVTSNNAVFMPAVISDGGSNSASDTIVFTSGNAARPLSAAPLVDTTPTNATTVVVSNAGGFQNGDFALLGAPGSGQPCLLFRVTAAPTVDGVACAGNATACTTLTRTGAATGYNPPGAVFATAPSYGFATDTGVVPAVFGPAVVTNLGSNFVRNAFAVQCQALIQYNAFTDAPACTQSPLGFSGGANALATDVVLMHAQYGLSAAANSDIVTSWVNATAAWAAPSAANVGRIKALRVVIVVRSKEAESTTVTEASCTNTNGVVNTGPCSFQDANAPVIDLSAVAVTAGKTWRHYRYRVHQAVVPLRNVIWSS